MLYSAINIGRDDRFVVVGRDLRPLAAMQQRLINAQQSMERDYVRLRHAETRYRLLFQVSSEAVMIVDAVQQRDRRRQSGGAGAVRRERAASSQIRFCRAISMLPARRRSRRFWRTFAPPAATTARVRIWQTANANAVSRCHCSGRRHASLFLVRLSSQTHRRPKAAR